MEPKCHICHMNHYVHYGFPISSDFKLFGEKHIFSVLHAQHVKTSSNALMRIPTQCCTVQVNALNVYKSSVEYEGVCVLHTTVSHSMLLRCTLVYRCWIWDSRQRIWVHNQ
uniref:Uncharacterized protein n=1 Tax=Anguilla anguilla TaxID=7936 RepID=A0A0E9X6M9_ANGAN